MGACVAAQLFHYLLNQTGDFHNERSRANILKIIHIHCKYCRDFRNISPTTIINMVWDSPEEEGNVKRELLQKYKKHP